MGTKLSFGGEAQGAVWCCAGRSRLVNETWSGELWLGLDWPAGDADDAASRAFCGTGEEICA